MSISYASGVRVGHLTVDPLKPVDAALWTHRPCRRSPARLTLAEPGLASAYPGAIGLPIGQSAVAMGVRVELMPSGYGASGVAALLTHEGSRTLVVGPTSSRLLPRHANTLVLLLPEEVSPAPEGWLERVKAGEWTRLSVVDPAAAEWVAEQLKGEGIAFKGPDWLGGGRRGEVTLSVGGVGERLDLRPQADEAWLKRFAQQVSPDQLLIYGPRAHAGLESFRGIAKQVELLGAPLQAGLNGLS